MGVLSGLEPKRVFEFFELLCSVPHGSGNVGAAADICENFAKERGLDCYRDEFNNVLIRKPATPGYEKDPTVIIQGHLDMVCAKAPDSTTDMSKEPITLVVDGDYVRADGTSLGADDGIAVAVGLAILDDDTLRHPALEVLFTADEETTMGGAAGIDPAQLKGRLLLNLDSEEDSMFTVGCAGGIRINTELPVSRESADGCIYAEVSVSGLVGGHSGAEIHTGRGNSHLILGRVLHAARKRITFRLCDMSGGEFANVIPSKTTAVVALAESDYPELARTAGEYGKILASEYAVTDSGVCVSAGKTQSELKPVSTSDTDRILGFLMTIPNGVIAVSPDFKGLTQTSLSTGILRMYEDKFFTNTFIRSSVESEKLYVADRLCELIRAFGGTPDVGESFPGWEYRRNSALRDKLSQVYYDINGKKPVITATHGGLECGLFCDKLPGLDCVSFGAEMHDIHSVNEKLGIASTGRLYALIREFLERH